MVFFFVDTGFFVLCAATSAKYGCVVRGVQFGADSTRRSAIGGLIEACDYFFTLIRSKMSVSALAVFVLLNGMHKYAPIENTTDSVAQPYTISEYNINVAFNRLLFTSVYLCFKTLHHFLVQL